ncbi:MAG: hypothetical protein WCA22_02135 [Candidatus Binatus sp.]
MAVLRGYFDDSGTHDETGQLPGSEVTGAAGYVATVPQWAKFDMEWRRALKAFEVPPEKFHAFDLQYKRGFFCDWCEEREREFVEKLSSIIDCHTMFGVAGFVLAKDLAQMPQAFRDEIKHPFFIGVNSMLHSFEKGPFVPELRKRHVNFFFENMKPFFDEEVIKIFSHLRDLQMGHVLGQITMGGEKKNMLPLHAADLAAYHLRAEISRLQYKPDLTIRYAMDALQKKYRLWVTYSSLKELRDLYFQLKIERARLA